MPDLAGLLLITASDREVTLRSTRPLRAARVFVGRPVTTILRQLPLLYSLCATAQTIACASAAEQAFGRDPGASARQARARLLAAEGAKEHLWRLLLDWPGALSATGAPPGEGATAPMMGRVLRAFAQIRSALVPWALTGTGASGGAIAPPPDVGSTLVDLARRIAFGTDPVAWLAQVTTPAELLAWAMRHGAGGDGADGPLAAALVRDLIRAGLAGLGRSGVPTLPVMITGTNREGVTPAAVAFLHQRLAAADADDFIGAPHWHGEPRETTPLARTRDWPLIAALVAAHGNGLLARLAALLVELALCCEGLVSGQSEEAIALAPAATGIGLACVEAARGLLVHRLVLDGERVADYRILAPTEWNFHPDGVVAAGLRGIAADLADTDDPMRVALLRRHATLHITAVDPCVDYALSVS